MLRLAEQEGYGYVIEGSNLDDQGDYRPGYLAVKELGIKSPLLESGFTKKEIRALAKSLGLEVWNKPAQPCLATRVPYGTMITPEILEKVKNGEAYLATVLADIKVENAEHMEGNNMEAYVGSAIQFRVRHHDNMARLEVPAEYIPLLSKPYIAQKITRKFQQLGYSYVTLDLRGYRQGSLNEILDDETLDDKISETETLGVELLDGDDDTKKSNKEV
jgi:uncharacterized protein